ncbi:MAG: DUF167 domain-containing protein [Phycisphaerales bacterium JB050]
MAQTVEDHPDSTASVPVSRLRIKAIPGAKRAGLGGLLGDRLKVKVNSPPEGGKANKAICRLIAQEIGVKPAQVSVEMGQTDHEKTLRVEGVSSAEVAGRLAI